jgi:GT2 family glycosyltransferase
VPLLVAIKEKHAQDERCFGNINDASTTITNARSRNMNTLCNRLSVVILTYNRANELLRTLEHMLALPEQPAIVVVDNASIDSTALLVRERFPSVTLISVEQNIGAAARNIGVKHVQTPYVAFADDDSWWAPGSLEEATRALDTYPQVAAVCARILLGDEEKEDPICKVMATSPLSASDLPGPVLLGFIACAVVFRRSAYLEAGGYEPKFFVGGEEELLTLDLVASGWSVIYMDNLTVHHHPSPQRDNATRRKIVIRNSLWVAWLRLPLTRALEETWRIYRSVRNHELFKNALLSALNELPWVYTKRRVLPPRVQHLYQKLRT